jgi:PadR family transcriptional regulator, regulatory protein PadR
MKSDDSKRNRTEFLVLLALSHGAMHGYEIAKFIDAKSKGFFSLPFGSLYPILHRLEIGKLISAKWDAQESLKPKKTYSLSAKGRKVLDEEIGVFRSYAKAIGMLLLEGAP